MFSVGTRHSVGIFFWTTNSEMDIRISNGPWFDATLEKWNTTGLLSNG